MNYFSLKDMVKGWFIGDFTPCALNSQDFEVAIKRYPANTIEAPHYHKIATEYTIIISGKVSINNKIHIADEIIQINPWEISSFKTITETVTCVVKVPSSQDDKFLVS